MRRATPNGNGKKNRQKPLPAPSPDALFRPRTQKRAKIEASGSPRSSSRPFKTVHFGVGPKKTEGVGWPRDAYFGVGCKKWKASGGLETPRNAIFDCPPLPHFMIMVVVSVVAHVTLGGASIVGVGEG